jgi:dTDP-3-amino-2,3,6-trideoxy-4-keto-D-glucose/dTDP-3-amino-3,4,6-trideoxy-alpha-D-glucose/dTDP-2,6-dideoxy-D-kanosamine transaminase
MPIKVWDYLEEYEAEREDLLEGIEKVFRSGRLILGESLKNFEEAFAAYCGVTHGVGVDNATNGITLALRALGIGAGDEVITVSNTAVPTVSAIVSCGAVPRFVDIDPDTYLMNVEQVSAAITDKTKCILPVHLFGQCADMGPLEAIAKQKGLKLLEDSSQSHGASQGSRKAGSMSDAAVFSFYPTKPLGAYGDGGLIATSDEAVAAKLRRLRFYGMDSVYYAEEHGYNSRLDELQAELLLRKLPRLDHYIEQRQKIARRYEQILGQTSIGLPQTAPTNSHVYYTYVCRHPERDRIIAELKERDIFINISYPWPIHAMRGYQSLGYKNGDLPNTELAATQIFSLPMYPTLRDEQQDEVCRALGDILSESVSI